LTTKDDSLRDRECPSSEGEKSRRCDRTAVGREIFLPESDPPTISQSLGQTARRLHAIWLELRNLTSRIALLRNNNWFRYGICLQSGEERAMLSHQAARKYQQARILGIRRLLANHPAATLVDFHLLLTTIHPCLFGEDQRKEGESQRAGDSRDTPEQERRTRTYPRSESSSSTS
jgi:hypothetical protein